MTAPGAARCGRPAQLSRPRRYSVYLVGAGLWLSGALWLVFHYSVRGTGEFGPPRHPLEPWWLEAHGAFAFASLWLLGLLWGVHMMAGWATGQRRWSGGFALAALGVLVLSGFLLYYLGDDTLRAAASLLHWSLGLASPLAFFAHRGVRRRRQLKAAQRDGGPDASFDAAASRRFG
jgi:hypothetical protein